MQTLTQRLQNLEPWSVTGFCDGEASFTISITRQKSKNISWNVKPSFCIEVHKQELPLLYNLQQFFKGIGNITVRSNRNTAMYRVLDIKSIQNIIISHFDQYPLLTQKSVDFDIFKQIVDLVANKAHLSEEGMNSIVSLRSNLNIGLSDKLKSEFPNIKLSIRPIKVFNGDLNPYWISGFTSAEGSFNIANNNNYFKVRFCLTQHSRDLHLLNFINKFFEGSGNITINKSTHDLYISSVNNCYNVVVPFFNKYPLIGLKAYNFSIWSKIVHLISEKTHLTEDGHKIIKELKNQLNKYS